MADELSPKQERIEIAYVQRLIKAGLTNDQLATALDVDTSTIYNWKDSEHENFWPDFLEAIKSREKDIADGRVERSLYERACGYEHEDVHISNYEGKITKTAIVKHYPPSEVACIYWLKNRKPKVWRDRKEISIDTPEPKDSNVTDGTLAAIADVLDNGSAINSTDSKSDAEPAQD